MEVPADLIQTAERLRDRVAPYIIHGAVGTASFVAGVAVSQVRRLALVRYPTVTRRVGLARAMIHCASGDLSRHRRL
jgi:hypothetical protein